MFNSYSNSFIFRIATLAIIAAVPLASCAQSDGKAERSSKSKVLTGQGAAGEWTTDAPGVRRRISVADMPKPYLTESVVNGPKLVPRPAGALPVVPTGFKVEEFASGFNNPRLVRVAPNGDIFVAESRANLVRVFRATKDGSKPEINEVFVADLKRPFGIAF